MKQTEHTAIVLRWVNYREKDRMLTLFSPTRGRVEAVAHGCRNPKSSLLNASEIFALGDFQLYEKNGRNTLTSAALIETFYPLRQDYERLACATYVLSICEQTVQPGVPMQDLFMLLLHTLSRLAFTEQPWRPLLSGFLVNYAVCEGFRPRLMHCINCGRIIEKGEEMFFDLHEGGICCREHRTKNMLPLHETQREFLSVCMQSPASAWVEKEGSIAPFVIMRQYVEQRLDGPVKGASSLPRS